MPPAVASSGSSLVYFVLSLELNFKAITDGGRDIPLFHYDALILDEPGQALRNFDPQRDRRELLLLQERELISSVRQGTLPLVRVSDPNPVCNCHGWVFTAGQFGIHNPHVPSVLRENGYEAVQVPQEGDLAIYRLADVIHHSGFVRQSSPGGQITVESKWGPFGVFLHPAEAYPGARSFYRSHRQGNMLAMGPIPK